MTEETLSIIKVRDVLVVTMPADPDDATISALLQKVLLAMERSPARGVVLDVSVVESLDSFFARTIAETMRMVGLMGGHTTLTGMRPSVAITITQLGLTLGKMRTALTVDPAFDILRDGPQPVQKPRLIPFPKKLPSRQKLTSWSCASLSGRRRSGWASGFYGGL